MIFPCTAKVQKRLRLTSSDLTTPPSGASATEWHCNVITLGRRPFFLFAHSLSLDAFLLVAAGHSEPTNFAETFRHYALGLLGKEGFRPNALHRIIDDGPDLFGKATDRGVLGSMVDFANMSRFVVEDEGGAGPAAILGAINLINESPMSRLEMESPRHALRTLLAATGAA